MKDNNSTGKISRIKLVANASLRDAVWILALCSKTLLPSVVKIQFSK